MPCEAEYTDEFEAWWMSLDQGEQVSVGAAIGLLEERASHLRYPFSSGVKSSRHGHMRELRIQHAGDPYRVFYAFDPRRVPILLVGGNKAGNDRFYEEHVPVADRLYDEHLHTLAKEGLI